MSNGVQDNEADDPQAGPSLGKILAILRVARGLHQTEAAAGANFSQSALSEYEKDKKTPHFSRIERLLSSMGYHLSAIDQTRDFLALLYRTHVFPRPEDRAVAPGLVAMKAALRREQRRFDGALELLRQAEVLDKSGDLRGVLLVSKAKTLEEANRPEEAIVVLREAEQWIDPKGDPRLTLCLRHNLLMLLIDLGSFAEADALLPEATALSHRLGNNRLDLIRLTWGEARIAAGVGDRERAITLFTQVRGEFMSRG